MYLCMEETAITSPVCPRSRQLGFLSYGEREAKHDL
jgi:hypothetical protein